MPKYHVTTLASQRWVYEVEADSAYEAERIVNLDRDGEKKLVGYPHGYADDGEEYADESYEV